MNRQRGGAIVGFLAAIGTVVVLMAIFFAACFNSASGVPAHRTPGVERHHRQDCRYDDCDSRGGRAGDGGQGDGSGYAGGGGRSGDERGGDGSCRNFCNITVPNPVPGGGDQQPRSLTNPSKIPEGVAALAKAGLDLGQLFANATIKFVEQVFVFLA